jgi:DNA-binding FadR family transcriptional regulator
LARNSDSEGSHAALVQLQAYLTQRDLPADSRLPPERELCESLGVSRGDLRKALAVLEPELTREAALHATTDDIAAMRQSLAQMRQAATWRQYENLDNLLHRQIAQASRSTLLLGMFDVLNAIRRAVVWGRLRAEGLRPPADHHSFADHDRIVHAIADRDLGGAAAAMRVHLVEVGRRLIPLREAAE